jgi:hypothetical protein
MSNEESKRKIEDSPDLATPATNPPATPEIVTPPDPPVSIEKPKGGLLSRFKTGRQNEGQVEKLLTALPHYKPSDARDFIRLHPHDDYWSDELFFATVPVQGMKDGVLHLITSELASELPPGRVERFRLALATKPYNHFFLAHIPSTNLDNIWNETCVRACTEARAKWRMVVSRKIEGKEGYDSEPTRNEKQGLPPPFPEPAWLKESLERIIEVSFEGKMILVLTDPAWNRLVGATQQIS